MPPSTVPNGEMLSAEGLFHVGHRGLYRMPMSTGEAERERQYEVARQQRIANKERPRSRLGSVLLALLLVFVLGAAAIVLLLRHAVMSGANGLTARLASAVLGRSYAGETSAPVVVEQIRRLNRLETVSFSVDTVVVGTRTNAVLPDLLFGDRLLLVVHGEVIAGVDLQQLSPEAVKVDGKSVTVELPRSQVFSTRVDENKSRVFARTTGLLVPTDPNLESDTRRTAEAQILASATADGILDTARANARGSLESLLHGLGFEQVTVR